MPRDHLVVLLRIHVLLPASDEPSGLVEVFGEGGESDMSAEEMSKLMPLDGLWKKVPRAALVLAWVSRSVEKVVEDCLGEDGHKTEVGARDGILYSLRPQEVHQGKPVRLSRLLIPQKMSQEVSLLHQNIGPVPSLLPLVESPYSGG